MIKDEQDASLPFVRPPIVESIDLDELEPGKPHRMRLAMTQNATGNETLVPVVVARAEGDLHPIVGITAAIHGNELNGMRVVQELASALNDNPSLLKRGTLIAVPLLNVPGYLNETRAFSDGVDLNRIMPGKANGNESELYAHRIMELIIKRCDYLFDLHTASFGRVNTHYVRCDLSSPVVMELAARLDPQIILHSPNSDGTLRGAAAQRGIHALTVEIGDPQRIQKGLVRDAYSGLTAALAHLGMLNPVRPESEEEVICCQRSYWMYTKRGGLLNVLPALGDRLKKGDEVARLFNVWGDLVVRFYAPEDSVVIGKSTNPTAGAGSRIVHLGVEGLP